MNELNGLVPRFDDEEGHEKKKFSFFEFPEIPKFHEKKNPKNMKKLLIEGYVNELNGLVPRFDDEEEERSITDLKYLQKAMCEKIPKVIRALLNANFLPDEIALENVVQLIHAYLRVASCCLYAKIQWNSMLECLEHVRIYFSLHFVRGQNNEQSTRQTDTGSESTILYIQQRSAHLFKR